MTAPAAPAALKGRLGNGQLRRQVAEYLADHPGLSRPAIRRRSQLLRGALVRLPGRPASRALTSADDR